MHQRIIQGFSSSREERRCDECQKDYRTTRIHPSIPFPFPSFLNNLKNKKIFKQQITINPLLRAVLTLEKDFELCFPFYDPSATRQQQQQ